ncbi:MAG: hypothetical protein NZ693_08550 [Thermoflexales bacterium]|nr:hypothetical protein [Thermoflexales bacterium]
MLSTLITVHGLIRWVTAAVGLAALAKFGLGWLGHQKFTSLDRKLGSAFAVVITIQFVLGLAVLVLMAINGGFRPAVHIEHAFYGVVATALAHGVSGLKRLPDAQRFRVAFLLVLASLVVVFFSVVRLRGTFFFGL